MQSNIKLFLTSIEHGLDVKVHTLEEILPIRLNCKLTLVKLVILIIFSGKLLNVLKYSNLYNQFTKLIIFSYNNVTKIYNENVYDN